MPTKIVSLIFLTACAAPTPEREPLVRLPQAVPVADVPLSFDPDGLVFRYVDSLTGTTCYIVAMANGRGGVSCLR